MTQRKGHTNRNGSSPSSLEYYIREIDKTPLLTATEEQELAERIAQGDYSARDHLVKANLRLVVSIARGYQNKGLSLDDLIEEGNLGLIRAVEGFDSMMATRFSTYASYWIKQSIRRAVMNNGKPIRLPAYMVSLLGKWKRVDVHLSEKYGRPATPEEIGKTLRLTKRKITMITKAIRISNLMPVSDGDEDAGPQIDEVIADGGEKTPFGVMIESEDVVRIMEHLRNLDEREETVIRMRFGLDPYNEAMTLREVGERLSLTRERVRQLENQAIAKLHNCFASEREYQNI